MGHQNSVYILKCSDGSYYTGITNNIERRLLEHRSKLNIKSYTFSRLPVDLVFVQQFKYVDKAIAFEKQVIPIKFWNAAHLSKGGFLKRRIGKCRVVRKRADEERSMRHFITTSV